MNEPTKVRVDARELQDLVSRIVTAEAILRRVKCDVEHLNPPARIAERGWGVVEISAGSAMEASGFLAKEFSVDDIIRLFNQEAA